MGNLKFGTNTPLALYMGVSGSTKAYFGTEVVYEDEPTPIDYSKEYLTFDILTGGTVNWIVQNATYAKTISYSLDEGNSWTDITSSTGGTSFNVNAGDRVVFRGNTRGTSQGTSDASNYANFSGSTAYFNLSGNIDSIADATNFKTGSVSLTSNYKALFRATNVVDASNLYLPSPTVEFQYRFLFRECASLVAIPSMEHFSTRVNYMCMGIFSLCTSLERATGLPSINFAESGDTRYLFAEMFSGCTNLNYVENYSINKGGIAVTYYPFNNWLLGVAASGTLVGKKASPLDVWVSGSSGIPSGWTFVEAS